MLTWQNVIESASNTFLRAGIEDARSNAEYLAMYVLGIWKKSELRARLSSQIDIDQAKVMDAYVSRRLQHEPLQYIIGETEFFGLRLFCSPAALIPRAETEIVVEEAVREAGRLLDVNSKIRILDIGTGSGAIILALANKLPNAECVGIDISADALQLAERNMHRLGLKNVVFHRADFLKTEFDMNPMFDLLVSNPPYIPVNELSELSTEVREFEPVQALTDGENGFSFYTRIAEVASTLLSQGGSVVVETEYKGAGRVTELFSSYGLVTKRVTKDLLGHDRVIVASIDT